MSFLNATLIFGLVAAAIPLVLHLMSKREPKSLPFPAVRFLTSSYQSNRSRLQVRHWWLLAMRMLAIAAVAVTLARPAIARNLSTTWLSIGIVAALATALLVMSAITYSTGQSKKLSLGLLAASIAAFVVSLGWGGVTAARGPTLNVDAQAPIAMAIIIDNSPTSAWAQDSQSFLQHHKTIAMELLSRLTPSSRIAIIDRSPEPASFSIDLSSAMAKVESLASRDVVAPMASRINAALRLVRTSELENRQVLIITDLAESTWTQQPESLQNSIKGAESPIAVTVINPLEFRGLNRRLDIPKVADQTPPLQTPTPVSITASMDAVGSEDMLSESTETMEVSVTIEMLIYETDSSLPVIRNGELVVPKTESVDRTNVRLSPGQSSEIVLRIPPLDEGTHHGLIRIVGDDAFSTDNERYFTVNVRPATPLLIVGADPEESFWIANAAAPYGWDSSNSEFKIDIISERDFLAARLDDYAAVVLLDPPADTLLEPMLVDYVKRGGGLFVCLGPAIKEPTRDEPNSAGSLLVPRFVRSWRVPEGTFLQSVRSTHPVLSPFDVVTGGVPWNQYLVTQYWQLDVPDKDAPERDIVLMKYESGHVALLERQFAMANDGVAPGRCVILTTPLPALNGSAGKWNRLFGSDAWPAVALVGQIAGYISGRDSAASTTTVGKPNVVPLNLVKAATDNGAERSNSRIQLFSTNSAQAVPIDVNASADSVIIPEVSHRGTYWLRGTDLATGFSANLTEDAAITRRISPSKLDEWLGAGNYALAETASDIDFSRGTQTQSVLLQSPAMLLALAVFLLEQVLSNRFYRSSLTKPSNSTRKGMLPA